MERTQRPYRIVLTGGPGGGKSTAADLFRREMGERIVVVPEAATLLFSAGFPREDHPDIRRAAQLAIFYIQRSLEDAQAIRYPHRVLLCDRGTVDGAIYWPTQPDDFFAEVSSTLEREMARYDAVLFFESAAVGGMEIESNNPARKESLAEAANLDAALKALWSHHRHFYVVPHSPSFLHKMTMGLGILQSLVAQLH